MVDENKTNEHIKETEYGGQDNSVLEDPERFEDPDEVEIVIARWIADFENYADYLEEHGIENEFIFDAIDNVRTHFQSFETGFILVQNINHIEAIKAFEISQAGLQELIRVTQEIHEIAKSNSFEDLLSATEFDLELLAIRELIVLYQRYLQSGLLETKFGDPIQAADLLQQAYEIAVQAEMEDEQAITSAYKHMAEGMRNSALQSFANAAENFGIARIEFQTMLDNESAGHTPSDIFGIKSEYYTAATLELLSMGYDQYQQQRIVPGKRDFESAEKMCVEAREDLKSIFEDSIKWYSEEFQTEIPADLRNRLENRMNLIDNLFMINQSQAKSMGLICYGQQLQERNRFEEAIKEFEAAKKSTLEVADALYRIPIPQISMRHTQFRNLARQLIPVLISSCERQSQLVSAQEEYLNISQRLHQISGGININNVVDASSSIDNKQIAEANAEALATAEASVEIVNEIRNNITDQLNQLIDDLPETNLPSHQKQELETHANFVKAAEDDRSFFDRLKRFGKKAKEIAESTAKIADDANSVMKTTERVVALLKTFAIIAALIV